MKDDKEKAGEILGQGIIIIHALSSMLEPFLPNSAHKLQKMLFNKLINKWELVMPKPGDPFQYPQPLFEKLDEETVLSENRNVGDD